VSQIALCQEAAADVATAIHPCALPHPGFSRRRCTLIIDRPQAASAKQPLLTEVSPVNTPESIRQYLARLADLQAALDALRTDLSIQLKETQTNA